jgi:hypothetical protein
MKFVGNPKALCPPLVKDGLKLGFEKCANSNRASEVYYARPAFNGSTTVFGDKRVSAMAGESLCPMI